MVNDIFAVGGLIVVLFAAGALLWVRWQKASDAERGRLIEDAVRRLVEAAEQQFSEPGQGKVKFSWVMGKLQKRFPAVDWELLAEYVEQAVLHLNASRQARQGANVNGKHDA